MNKTMQNAAQQFLEKNRDPEMPLFISFQDMAEHTLILGESNLKTITDRGGTEIEGVEYAATEDGIAKTFFTTSYQLLNQIANLQPGTKVTIQMTKGKNQQGQYRTGYNVKILTRVLSQEEKASVVQDFPDENISVVNE